jgi:hypothetical protein
MTQSTGIVFFNFSVFDAKERQNAQRRGALESP